MPHKGGKRSNVGEFIFLKALISLYRTFGISLLSISLSFPLDGKLYSLTGITICAHIPYTLNISWSLFKVAVQVCFHADTSVVQADLIEVRVSPYCMFLWM